jgi:hypothetical protein
MDTEIAWANELQIFFEVFCDQTARAVFHSVIFLTVENPFQQSIYPTFIGIDLEFVSDDKSFDSLEEFDLVHLGFRDPANLFGLC